MDQQVTLKNNWMERKRMSGYRRINGPTYEDTGHMYHAYTCTCTCTSVFLISSYGAPLVQRASYLAPHSSLFGTDGSVNYDYMVTNSINSLLIGSRCIPNGTHTNYC